MKKESIGKVARGKTRRNYLAKLSYATLYTAGALLCLIPAYLEPFLLFILVPLFMAPLGYAFQSVNHALNMKRDPTFSSFFRSFTGYYKAPVYGAYRLAIGNLKALGIYFLFQFLGYYPVLLTDQTFMTGFQSLLVNNEAFDLNAFENLLSSDSLILQMQIVQIVALFPAAIMFLHSVGVSAIRVHLSFMGGGLLSMYETGQIFAAGFKTIRKPFRKEYFKATWFISPLLLIGYVLGAVPAAVFLPVDAFKVATIGLAVMSLVLLFILPYYFDVIETLFYRHGVSFAKASIALSLVNLDRLKAGHRMSAAEEKEIKKFIDQAKAALKKMDEEDLDSDEPTEVNVIQVDPKETDDDSDTDDNDDASDDDDVIDDHDEDDDDEKKNDR